MKSRTLTCITTMIAFVVLATPLQLTAQHTQYTVTHLGTLDGTFSIANGMNNKGWVAGGSLLPGDEVIHAFLWRKGEMMDLGTLGGPGSIARDRINESGEVSGFADTSIPNPVEGGLIFRAFLWRKGVMTALPNLGGNNAVGQEVNNRGQVAGTTENSILDGTCDHPRLQHKPVIWHTEEADRIEVEELPTFPGDPDGLALGITESGVAVGVSGNCANAFTAFHNLLWQDGTMTDLGNLGGTIENIAEAINNSGQIVGRSGLAGDESFHAFLWQSGVMMDLGTLPRDFFSAAFSLNNKESGST